MARFAVLVVDDEDGILKIAEDELAGCVNDGSVMLITCDSVDSAETALDDYFFQLAFVDLSLHNRFENGRTVLQLLIERAPSCERIAMTQHIAKNVARWVDLISPSDSFERKRVGGSIGGTAHGIIAKPLDSGFFERIVLDRLSTWIPPGSVLTGVDSVATSVQGKTLTRDRSRGVLRKNYRIGEGAVRAELSHMLWSLFSGVRGMRSPLELRFSELSQGLSGSVTSAVEVRIDKSADAPIFGSRTVLKFGSRSSVSEEVESYLRVVRYGVPLDARVELLDYAFGDSLGSIAYSFAGGGSAAVRSLDQLGIEFLAGADAPEFVGRAVEVVHSLFDPDRAVWYRTSGAPMVPVEFFTRDLHVDFDKAVDRARKRLTKLAKRVGATLTDDTLVIGGANLALPSLDDLGGVKFLKRFPTCLVHGDMHGGNILVEASGRYSLIDFAHAGFGPRAVDAAVLGGSIRLWDSLHLPYEFDSDELPRALATRIEEELKLARSVRSVVDRVRPSQKWVSLARTVDDGLRATFRDMNDEELLVTAIAHCVRMMGFDFGERRLNELGTLRLLCWYTALQKRLAEAA